MEKLATSLPLSQWLEQLRFSKGIGSITVENSYIYIFLCSSFARGKLNKV